MVTSARARGAPHSLLIVGVLGAGLFAICWAAILVRLCQAPSLSIATWRLAMAFMVMAPWLLNRRRRDALAGLTAKQRAQLVGAGLFLGVHFWTWIASLAFTTVAASVLLVTTNPIWVGLLSPWVLREHLSRRTWCGILVATAGAAYVALGADQGQSSAPILGNTLALVGAWAASGYLLIGHAVRRRLDVLTYATATVGVGMVVVGIAAIFSNVPLWGFEPLDWLLLAAIAAGPQLVGHNALNWSLRWVRADVVALALLVEPIGAGLIAWWVLGEAVSSSLMVGGVVLLSGLAIAMRWGRLGSAPPGAAVDAEQAVDSKQGAASMARAQGAGSG